MSVRLQFVLCTSLISPGVRHGNLIVGRCVVAVVRSARSDVTFIIKNCFSLSVLADRRGNVALPRQQIGTAFFRTTTTSAAMTAAAATATRLQRTTREEVSLFGLRKRFKNAARGFTWKLTCRYSTVQQNTSGGSGGFVALLGILDTYFQL